MNTHRLHLAPKPFLAITEGRKTVESRLYDDKRKLIELGDRLLFVNNDDSSKVISANVIGLLRYRNFSEMFSHNICLKFGGESVEQLERQINEFYTHDDQHTSGVIGIEFELM